MRKIPMLCTIALAAPLALLAQSPVNNTWPLATGSSVRILSPVLGDKKEQGTVVSMSRESILFQQKSARDPQSLGVSSISQIDVLEGTHSRKLKGLGWGAVIGGALAAGVTAATWKQPKNCGLCIDFGRGGDSAFLGAIGAVVGGVVGLIVGAMPTETWVPVEVPRP